MIKSISWSNYALFSSVSFEVETAGTVVVESAVVVLLSATIAAGESTITSFSVFFC